MNINTNYQNISDSYLFSTIAKKVNEFAAAKPDKKYFDYVLAHIPGASTENCLVIGDSLSADIKGAQNAGLDSLWYNPNRKANTLPIPPNFEAASYEDIVRILL